MRVEKGEHISPSSMYVQGLGEGGIETIMAPDLRQLARSLRQRQTDVEQMLWKRLRDRQALALKFRRQHPIGNYIVDFCCVEKRLIVELDGGQHACDIQADELRTRRLMEKGIACSASGTTSSFKIWTA